MGLIDTHAHLTFPELHDRVDDLLARCAREGVDRIITVGTDLADARRAVDMAARYTGTVYAAAGIHPHEAEKVSEDDLSAMSMLWDRSEVVALGEMGLDYHYDFADRGVQRTVFARQLELAGTRPKPLVIHSREALDDTIELLLDHGFDRRPVVFHCFTDGEEEAGRIAEHGWRMSFTGVVTFRKSTELQRVAGAYPGEQLMIETDSPYLSPEPVRGRRPNEPANVVHIARFLAALRGVSYEVLARETARNSREFFNLG